MRCRLPDTEVRTTSASSRRVGDYDSDVRLASWVLTPTASASRPSYLPLRGVAVGAGPNSCGLRPTAYGLHRVDRLQEAQCVGSPGAETHEADPPALAGQLAQAAAPFEAVMGERPAPEVVTHTRRQPDRGELRQTVALLREQSPASLSGMGSPSTTS